MLKYKIEKKINLQKNPKKPTQVNSG
jgi:hypothetical protein